MKTSSFIYGAIVGAAVYRMMSKNRMMSLTSMLRNANLGQMADNAMDKVMDMTGGQQQGGSRRDAGSPSSGSSHASHRAEGNQHGIQASPDTKAAHLKELKNFIRSNPEVKHEVEQILKETHTVIPGL